MSSPLAREREGAMSEMVPGWVDLDTLLTRLNRLELPRRGLLVTPVVFRDEERTLRGGTRRKEWEQLKL